MNDALLRLYHRLPVSTRFAVASLRGYYLRHWRYGRETEQLVEEALEREHWDAKDWRRWQEQRLAFILERAATHVPYYREYWAVRRQNGDRSSWQYLENWPILEKESVREHGNRFVADDCNIRRMFHEHTSGTTGKSLNLWWSRKTVRTWYALFEARCRRWYGVSRGDRWAMLGGQLVTPVGDRRPPFWVWNSALNQLYMSSYHLAPDLIPYYLDALRRYDIRYMFGYTSSLYALAQEVVQLGRKDLQMAVIITNAEPLFGYQRKMIAQAFQCQVRNTYGMAEIVAAASECCDGRLHFWPEVGYVEVFENDEPVKRGVTGDLICTGLLNSDMPFVRYRVGDRGAVTRVDRPCPCGRGLPELRSVDGRKDDVLYTPDGRFVGRLDPIFKGELPVREAQIVQESRNRVRIRYVPGAGFSAVTAQLLVDRLRDRLGAMQICLESVDEIPRGSNGKFRAVICKISDEEKRVPCNSAEGSPGNPVFEPELAHRGIATKSDLE